jgi:hypothetical protein
MVKRLFLAGTAGGLAVILLSIVVNGVFGFRSRVDLNRIADERRVYDVLKECILKPGAYMCNPQEEAGRGFPPGEPVFSIRYGGMGHESAGMLFLLDLAIAFATAILAAWLLSLASDRVLRGYLRSAGFVALIGLVVALFGDLPKMGIGGYPPESALLLSAYDIVSWAVCGLVIAWLMRRGAHAFAAPQVA